MFLLTPGEISRDYRTLKRFLKILEIMTRFGFQDIADAAWPNWRRRAKKREEPEEAVIRRSRPERLRLLFEALGPTFVKLGQILSTRPDLITAPYADELAKLTEHVTPFSEKEMRGIIRSELGREPEELFRSFEKTPMAAASIGQVHGAVLKDGTAVVVKIQRPGARETINVDLDIMFYLARKLEDMDAVFARYEPVRIVDEFAYSLRRELNYQIEAANLLRFRKNMEDDDTLVVPRVFLDLSTTRVLTMERIYGDSAALLLTDEKIREKYDLKLVAERGVNSLLKQIFVDGFFHADPHPGNIFLLDGNRISFIDFGMMGRINDEERQYFVRIIDYMLRGEIERMTDVALHLTISGRVSGNRDRFNRDVADLVDENINLPLEKLSVAHILEELLELFNRYKLALKPNLYMMFKALISIEHLGRSFYPDLRIIEMVKPFIQRLKLHSYDPRPMLTHFLDTFGDNMKALNALPMALQDILANMRSGKITLRVEHHRLDDLEETVFITGERLSRSLLVAALLMASGLVVVARIPPFIGEIPLIGMGGFLISGLLSVLILLDDHRQRKKFLREREKRRQSRNH